MAEYIQLEERQCIKKANVIFTWDENELFIIIWFWTFSLTLKPDTTAKGSTEKWIWIMIIIYSSSILFVCRYPRILVFTDTLNFHLYWEDVLFFFLGVFLFYEWGRPVWFWIHSPLSRCFRRCYLLFILLQTLGQTLNRINFGTLYLFNFHGKTRALVKSYS